MWVHLNSSIQGFRKQSAPSIQRFMRDHQLGATKPTCDDSAAIVEAAGSFLETRARVPSKRVSDSRACSGFLSSVIVSYLQGGSSCHVDWWLSSLMCWHQDLAGNRSIEPSSSSYLSTSCPNFYPKSAISLSSLSLVATHCELSHNDTGTRDVSLVERGVKILWRLSASVWVIREVVGGAPRIDACASFG